MDTGALPGCRNEAYYSRRKCGQAIGEVESLLADRSEKSFVHMPFSLEEQHRLSKSMDFQTQVTLFTSYSSLVRIVEAVRTTVLNWSLKLEEDGILGEGLLFSPEEVQQADSASYNVNNFYGPVQSPNVQQGTSHSVQSSTNFSIDGASLETLIATIRDQLADLKLDSQVEAEASAEVATVEAQLKSPKPKASIIRESLKSLRSIFEGAAGGAGASLVIEISKMLS